MQQTGHPRLHLVREAPSSLRDYKMNFGYLREKERYRQRSQKLIQTEIPEADKDRDPQETFALFSLHLSTYTNNNTFIKTTTGQASPAITFLPVGLWARAAQCKRKLRSHQCRGEKVNFSCLKSELFEFLRQEAELLCLIAALVF